MTSLALAAGSIVYVIVQLLHVGQRLGHREAMMWGLFGGLMFGDATELVLVAGRRVTARPAGELAARRFRFLLTFL